MTAYWAAPVTGVCDITSIPDVAGLRNFANCFLLAGRSSESPSEVVAVATYTVDPSTGIITGPNAIATTSAPMPFSHMNNDGSVLVFDNTWGSTTAIFTPAGSRTLLGPTTFQIHPFMIEANGASVTLFDLGAWDLPDSGGDWTVPAGALVEQWSLSLALSNGFGQNPNAETSSNLVYRRPEFFAAYNTGSNLGQPPFINDAVMVLRVNDIYQDYPPLDTNPPEVGYTVLMTRTGGFALLQDMLPAECNGLTGAPFDTRTCYCSIQEWQTGTGPLPTASQYRSSPTGPSFYVACTLYDASLSPSVSFLSIAGWEASIFTGAGNTHVFNSSMTPNVVWAQNGAELWYLQWVTAFGDWWFGPTTDPSKFSGNFGSNIRLGPSFKDYDMQFNVRNAFPTPEGIVIIGVATFNSEPITVTATSPKPEYGVEAIMTIAMRVGYDGSVHLGTKFTNTPYVPDPGTTGASVPSGVSTWAYFGDDGNPSLGGPKSGFPSTSQYASQTGQPDSWPSIVLLHGNNSGPWGSSFPFMLQSSDFPDYPPASGGGGPATAPRGTATPSGLVQHVSRKDSQIHT